MELKSNRRIQMEGRCISEDHRLPIKKKWSNFLRWGTGSEMEWNVGFAEASIRMTEALEDIYTKSSTPEELAENMQAFIADRKLFSEHAEKNWSDMHKP